MMIDKVTMPPQISARKMSQKLGLYAQLNPAPPT
jgi:hypothetical protein